MTINSIIPLSHEDEMRSIEAHLKDFLYSWKGATTIEERERIEGLAIDTTLRLLDSAFEFSEISVGESLNDQKVLGESQEWKRHFDHLRNKFDSLSERYVSYFNRRQIKLLELYSSLKRIKQKKASLDIQGESLVGVAEKFLTWDNLSTRHTTGTPCAIETAQGVMTLPVESVVDIKVSGVTIGGKSNGRPGNSDIEVRADLSNPKNMFDNSLNTWFEYERLDEGPLLLQLNIELPKEEIINNIVIVPVLFGLTKGFKIEDISFSSSGKETKNIKELTIAEDNFWQISGDKEEWSVTFLPVATKNITLSFRQSSYSVIEVARINNRKADRKRYGIGIKELKLRQKQFLSNGVMGSLELPCQAGLYVAQPVVNAFPRNPSIWTMGLDSSVDSGVTWFNHGDVVNGIGKLLYLEGNGGTLTWRTSVSRLDNSFATLSSLISEPFKIKNIDSVLKSVSRFQSPAIFALKSKPQDGQVFVFQAQVGKRGDKFSPIFSGTGTGSKMAFDLPFSVLEYNIDPDDVKILVNKTEYSFNPDISSLGLEEWSFSADHRQVVFSDDLPDRCKVEMYLEEERMLLEESSTFDFLFKNLSQLLSSGLEGN